MFKKVLVLSISAILSATVIAGPGKSDRDGMRKILKQLDLSTEQRQDIQQILQDGRQDRSVFKADFRDFGQQLRAQVQSDSFDSDAVKTLLQGRSDLRAELALERAQRRHQVWQLLSDEQKSEFEQQLSEREARDPKDRIARRLAKLDLTAEQQSQINQIMAENLEQREAAKAQRSVFKAAQAELIKAEEFDQEAWQALFEQQQVQMVQNGVLRAQARHQVWNLLTEDQQAKAEKMMKKRFKKRQQRDSKGSV